MKIPIIIILLFLIILTAIQIYSNNSFNNWSEKCLEDGGIIMPTKKGLFGEEFECVGFIQKIQLQRIR